MIDNRAKILVLDDDTDWLEQVPEILGENYVVDGYPTIEQGLKAIETHFYDILLLDLNFENDHRSGLDLFKQVHALDRGIDIIVISAETNRERLIEIFNAGASQFISKPATPNELREKVKKTMDLRESRLRAIRQSTSPESSKLAVPFVGSSEGINRLKTDISRIIKAGVKDVLLQGESGTGKELIARMIAQSDRSGRFIVVHCGAISDTLVEAELFGSMKGSYTGSDHDRVGAFEAASGGTIFLDEIGDMPLNQQAKLLRVLQERKVQRIGSVEERSVSFKCIAATHRDLEQYIQEEKFRADLYYRVRGEVIRIPPLRERVEDIPELIYHFIANHPCQNHRKKTLTQEAVLLLQGHSWPGNVRELKIVVESLCNRTDGNMIREKDVCKALPDVANLVASRITKALVGKYGASLIANERKRFEKAIIRANGDRKKAAHILGISRATFFRKAKDLGLVKERRDG